MSHPQPTHVVWRVSSKSNGTNCVEVAHSETVILVRDTKNRDQGMLSVSTPAWKAFIKAIQTGRH
jgi:hypothetical protein